MGSTSRDRLPGPKHLRALYGALEHSLTIQRARLQQVIDEFVGDGSLSRADADRLVERLLGASRDYSQALLHAVQEAATDAQRRVGGGLETGIAQVKATADKLADAARKAPRLVAVPSGRQESGAQASRFPIARYAELTVAQIRPLLGQLDPAELRRVRATEAADKARKGVLREIDRLLQ
jgi:polyhydroxyalkanoate synthesis regulator phasin